MKMILNRKKAVSPVIATILLIALTVTAAAIVYFVVVPLLRANPDLVYTDHGKVIGYNNRYSVTIVNNGGADASIVDITEFTFTLDNGTENVVTHVYKSAGGEVTTWPLAILQGETITLHFEVTVDFQTGDLYTFACSYGSGKLLEITFTY